MKSDIDRSSSSFNSSKTKRLRLWLSNNSNSNNKPLRVKSTSPEQAVQHLLDRYLNVQRERDVEILTKQWSWKMEAKPWYTVQCMPHSFSLYIVSLDSLSPCVECWVGVGGAREEGRIWTALTPLEFRQGESGIFCKLRKYPWSSSKLPHFSRWFWECLRGILGKVDSTSNALMCSARRILLPWRDRGR